MKYEAIFCDFDGTLLADDFKISKLNRQAIKEYIDFGGKFIISTGRLFQSIYPHLIDLGITKGKVIVSQGSCIYDIETKQLVYEKTITKEHTLAIADYVESQMEKYPNRIVNVVYIDDNCWTISKNPYVDKLCSLIKVQPQFTEMEISKFFKTHEIGRAHV